MEVLGKKADIVQWWKMHQKCMNPQSKRPQPPDLDISFIYRYIAEP